MPRQRQNVEFNTFVGGLVTEAGPLTFPENASLAEDNFVLNRDGSRNRRLGMDIEAGGVYTDSGVDASSRLDFSIQVIDWEDVGNEGGRDFVGVQIGTVLKFFDSNKAVVSDNPVGIGGADISVDVISGFASVDGRLILTTGAATILIVEYDVDSDSFTSYSERLTARDLWGVADPDDLYRGNGVRTRPLTLTDEHSYNLRNQGWPEIIKSFTNLDGDNATLQDPVQYTFDQVGFYPANSDLLSFGLDASASEVKAVGSYSPFFMETIAQTTSRAPQGSAIIDVFDRGDGRTSFMDGLGFSVTLPTDVTIGGVTEVATFAGRAFYALSETSLVDGDAQSPSLGSTIFFSQSTGGRDGLTTCYTEADPSADQLNDPIATDGGFITLPEASEVVALVPRGDSLNVVCTNGVWEIHGGETSFSATNQNVFKVTSVGAVSGSSVLVAEDQISYWGDGGIYLIGANELTLRGQSSNITEATIQRLYNDIRRKSTSVGTYDPTSRQMRWLYQEDTLAVNQAYYDRELIYDVTLQAWYTNTFGVDGTTSQYVSGYVPIPKVLTVATDLNVVVLGDPVVVGVDTVIMEYSLDVESFNSTKYLITYPLASTSFTFGEFNETTYADFGTVDATAFLLTGYTTLGETQRDKKVKKMTVHCRRTDTGFVEGEEGGLDTLDGSSCLVQAQWEWTDSIEAGRWGREFQAYRLPRLFLPQGANDPFDYSFTVVTTKNKLRGKGRALSLSFRTEPAKNLHIYGWALDGTQETEV